MIKRLPKRVNFSSWGQKSLASGESLAGVWTKTMIFFKDRMLPIWEFQRNWKVHGFVATPEYWDTILLTNIGRIKTHSSSSLPNLWKLECPTSSRARRSFLTSLVISEDKGLYWKELRDSYVQNLKAIHFCHTCNDSFATISLMFGSLIVDITSSPSPSFPEPTPDWWPLPEPKKNHL